MSWTWLFSPTEDGDALTPVLVGLQVASDLVIAGAWLFGAAAIIWLGRVRRGLLTAAEVAILAAAAILSSAAEIFSATTPGLPPTLFEGAIHTLATLLDVVALIVLLPILPRIGQIFADRNQAMDALAASEAEYRAVFDAEAVGNAVLDPATNRILMVNAAMAAMLGYRPEQLVGVHLDDLGFDEDKTVVQDIAGEVNSGRLDAWRRERRFRRGDGTAFWARVSNAAIRSADGQIKVLSVVQDIDAQRQAEEALRASEATLRLAVEAARISIWEIDFELRRGRLDARSPGSPDSPFPLGRWVPLGGPEITAWLNRMHPEDRVERDRVEAAIRSGASDLERFDYRVRTPGGAWQWLSQWRAVVSRDPVTRAPTRAISVVMDITERALAEAELRLTLRQRDLLLREVYHRVKNNLQVVDGLIMMQARKLGDTDAARALYALRSRIYALGLVHHQLMASDDLETFDVKPFLAELVRNIVDGSGHAGARADVEVEAMEVDLDFALPLGLLVTELVTNALKHALPETQGRVSVSLRRTSPQTCLLTVADNGPGLSPEGLAARGVGSAIIDGLVGQLDGDLSTRNQDGLVVEIRINRPERK